MPSRSVPRDEPGHLVLVPRGEVAEGGVPLGRGEVVARRRSRLLPHHVVAGRGIVLQQGQDFVGVGPGLVLKEDHVAGGEGVQDVGEERDGFQRGGRAEPGPGVIAQRLQRGVGRPGDGQVNAGQPLGVQIVVADQHAVLGGGNRHLDRLQPRVRRPFVGPHRVLWPVVPRAPVRDEKRRSRQQGGDREGSLVPRRRHSARCNESPGRGCRRDDRGPRPGRGPRRRAVSGTGRAAGHAQHGPGRGQSQELPPRDHGDPAPGRFAGVRTGVLAGVRAGVGGDAARRASSAAMTTMASTVQTTMPPAERVAREL